MAPGEEDDSRHRSEEAARREKRKASGMHAIESRMTANILSRCSALFSLLTSRLFDFLNDSFRVPSPKNQKPREKRNENVKSMRRKSLDCKNMAARSKRRPRPQKHQMLLLHTCRIFSSFSRDDHKDLKLILDSEMLLLVHPSARASSEMTLRIKVKTLPCTNR